MSPHHDPEDSTPPPPHPHTPQVHDDAPAYQVSYKRLYSSEDILLTKSGHTDTGILIG